MLNPFEYFAREHDSTAIAVYNNKLAFLESNAAFDKIFSSCRECSLPDLFALMPDGETFLAQMMVFVDVEEGTGACSVSYISRGDRRELKVKLIALGNGDKKEYICSFTDVSEFMFIQKALVHRSDSLEKLARNSPVGVFKAAPAGNVLYVNNGLVSMLGYDNEYQLFNRELSATWVTPQDRDTLLELLRENRQVTGFETLWRRRDGGLFWVSLTAVALVDSNDNLVNFEVVVLDIDEKKRAEEDLKRLQLTLHHTIESKTAELKRANDLLLREVAVRQRAETVYAVLSTIAEKTLATESLYDLLHLIHTQLSRIIHTRNIYFAFYNRESDTYSFPYSVDDLDDLCNADGDENLHGSLTDYVRREGKPLLLDRSDIKKMIDEKTILAIGHLSEQWMGVPLRNSDGVWGVLVVQSYTLKNVFSEEDLTLFAGLADSISVAIDRYRTEQNRKRIEVLYNTVVNNLEQGVVMCDPDDNILFANKAFSRLLGLSPEEVSGMSLASFISKKDAGRVAAVRELRNMGVRSSYNITLLKPNGGQVSVVVHGIPRIEGEDRFVGTIGLIEIIEEAENFLD